MELQEIHNEALSNSTRVSKPHTVVRKGVVITEGSIRKITVKKKTNETEKTQRLLRRAN